MKITDISASVRDNSQSLKVSGYLAKQLKSLSVDSTVLDLNKDRLPLYNDEKTGPWQKVWSKISRQLSTADGFVFVSPEWDGMFSVGLHNMFHYADDELAHKPILLVGVSDGRGGRYPLQQMRTMGYKNRRFVVIPESLFFDQIKDSLVDGEFVDPRNSKRAGYALKVLIEYSKSLRAVRDSGVIDHEQFPSGL